MKATIKIKKEIDVRYLKVDAGVRYWEDTVVNGEDDFDLSEYEVEKRPKIPFAVKVKDNQNKKLFSDYRWQPTIDVDRGCIVDWPKGTTAQVHYKVCDDGFYHLIDAFGNYVASANSYVPDCIGEYGDYIVMNINEEGYIDGFRFTQEDVNEIIKSDFGYKEN